MTHRVIQVEGMTCGHCVETVTQAVKGLKGTQSVSVDLDKKQVTVDYDEAAIDLKSISAKITEVGFEVVGN